MITILKSKRTIGPRFNVSINLKPIAIPYVSISNNDPKVKIIILLDNVKNE